MTGGAVRVSSLSNKAVFLLSPQVSQLVNAKVIGSSPLKVSGGLKIRDAAESLSETPDGPPLIFWWQLQSEQQVVVP